MLKSLDEIFYPMTADIYYSTQTQNDMGEVTKTWSKDRTIACSAIKRNTDSRIAVALDPEKFIEYDLFITMRTNEDILKSSDESSYRITDILVRDIKDNSGKLVWKESADESTVFEIRNVEPMFNMFSVLEGYRIALIRSDNQDI